MPSRYFLARFPRFAHAVSKGSVINQLKEITGRIKLERRLHCPKNPPAA
jgi:hypothetical protein